MKSENTGSVCPSFIQFLDDSNNYSQTIENLKNLDFPPEMFAQYINFMQEAPVSIIFIDHLQNILFTNKTFEYKVQKKQSEIVGTPIASLVDIHLIEEDQQEILLEATENKHWSGTFSYIDEENKVKKVWLKVTRFTHPKKHPTFGILFFDSENVNYRDFSNHTLSYYDSKTFLPNFNQFSFDINQLIQKKDRNIKGLALIRCQNLSEITAHHSSKIMAEVTMTMIRRIKEVLPKGYFLYRLSRDIFALFSTRITDEQEFKDLIEEIYEILLEPLLIEDKQIFLTNEIGVAFYPSQVKDLNQLLLNAEICLNQRDTSKVVYYSEEINRRYTFSLQTIERLQSALEQNQIKILYNPIVGVTGKIKAAEALIDWQDEELGAVSPLNLLKGAKEYGHIHKLTAWILNKVAKDKLFETVPVTIKLDATQITDPLLLPALKKHLEQGTLNTTGIIFEITEHEGLTRCAIAMKALKQLKSLGFQLGIDNFGAGYSDLTLLTDLAIDILKVDTSLVSGVTEEPKKKVILKHILLLAKELELVTCLKGIKTESEFQCALSICSDCVQGPYFSTPLSLTNFTHKYL